MIIVSSAETPRMRIRIALALLFLLGCGPVAADTVYYRCLEAGKQTNILLVTIDPLLGEMRAERYSGKVLQRRTTYRIDVLDEATIRGLYVVPILGIMMVLELDRPKRRVTEMAGGKEPTYYDCEPPSAAL
jgi:hypothetical protein